MSKLSMRKMKEQNEYKKSLANLIRTGKSEELIDKLQDFLRQGTGFTITKMRRIDFNRVINRDRKFFERLGFKEINIQSTKTSKRANKLIKIARREKGKVYYNCSSEKKLAFLIPRKEKLKVSIGLGKERLTEVDCYTIIIL